VTVLGSIPSAYGVGSLVQSGANRRFYSEFEPHSNTASHVFSVTAAPGGQQAYAPQTLVPELAQTSRMEIS
jgi:hypothetical protein